MAPDEAVSIVNMMSRICCAVGDHLPAVVILSVNQLDGPDDYMKYILEDKVPQDDFVDHRYAPPLQRRLKSVSLVLWSVQRRST